MKKLFVLLLVLMLCASTAFANFIPLTFKNGDSVSICARQWYQLELESGKEMEWSSSNEDVFSTLPSRNDVIIATGFGSANLNGKAKDGSGDKVKVKITVPKVYTTHDKIVIDSPEGVEFGYAFNISGFLSVSHSGKCFTTEGMDDVGEINMSRLLPVKVGTGSIVFQSSGRTIKTVKIEVKKSAFEAPVSVPEGACVAIVSKDVNIRKEPNADSKKMGSAKKGDKLIVTQAFYTNKWHQIDFNGETCYVSANYCDIKAAEPSEASTQKTQRVQATAAVKDKLEGYIRMFSLTEECKNVILEYLPNINDFAKIEQEATLSYAIVMKYGVKYYLTVDHSKAPVCLQSGESDYKSRTRFYDKFAK